MQHTEETEQIKLCMLLDWNLPKLLWFAIPNGGKRTKYEAVRLKKQGVKSGVADIFICESAQGWNGLFIEMKSKTGKLSKTQNEFLKRALENNYSYHVCYSAVEAFNLVKSYLTDINENPTN